VVPINSLLHEISTVPDVQLDCSNDRTGQNLSYSRQRGYGICTAIDGGASGRPISFRGADKPLRLRCVGRDQLARLVPFLMPETCEGLELGFRRQSIAAAAFWECAMCTVA
jgi:hypothetical protein